MKFLLSLLLVLVALPLLAQNTDTIRVCTYNVLNFSPEIDFPRISAISNALIDVDPDIVLVQELLNTKGITEFTKSFTGESTLRTRFGVGFDGPDTDNGLLLSNRVEYVSHTVHATLFRNIDEFVLHVRETTDTLHIFVCHLTEGEAPVDKEMRLQEAIILRRALDSLYDESPGHHRVVAGDLGIYSSSEPAYAMLTTQRSDARGEVVDPINRPGNWHANESFTGILTASTRVREFGGGTGGGLNDRFDFLLLSPSLMDGEYVAGSYTAHGNDGNHFQDSINQLPNTAVRQSDAMGLHRASDHLPVYLDLVFQKQSSGVKSEPEWERPHHWPIKEMDLTMREISLAP